MCRIPPKFTRRMESISAKNLGFWIPPLHQTSELYERLRHFEVDRGVFDSIKITDGTVLMSARKPIRLNHGMETLKDILKMDLPPTRIPIEFPFPEKVLRTMFPDGYDAKKIIAAYGTRYSEVYINEIVNIEKVRAKNAMITKSGDLQSMIENGTATYGQLSGIVAGRKLVAAENRSKQYCAKPVLSGPLSLHFRKYDSNGQPVEGAKETEVTIYGRPNDSRTKKKHWYIYSRESGYGKSTVTREMLVDKYSAYIVGDVNNAADIPAGVRFLILDEYGPHKKLEFDKFKAITGGKCSEGLNKKSFGESYTPCSDVQVIILSNYSPYQVYAKYCKFKGTTHMSEDDLSALDQRFHIIRLDGDDDVEKLTWMVPSSLTPQQLRVRITKLFHDYTEDLGSDDIATAGVYHGIICKVYRLLNLWKNNAHYISRNILIRWLPELTDKFVISWETAVFELCDVDGAIHTGLDLKRAKFVLNGLITQKRASLNTVYDDNSNATDDDSKVIPLMLTKVIPALERGQISGVTCKEIILLKQWFSKTVQSSHNVLHNCDHKVKKQRVSE